MTASGAFSQTPGNNTGNANSSGMVNILTFKASNSNAMFNGSANQPAAGLTLLCIKS